MDALRPQLKMLHDYLDREIEKIGSYHFDCCVVKPVDDDGYLTSLKDHVVHEMMLDLIGYGRAGNEFLSYREHASSYPFDSVSPFRRPPTYHVLYNDDVGVYGAYLCSPADAVPAAAHRCNDVGPGAGIKSRNKALDIVDPATGVKLQFSAK